MKKSVTITIDIDVLKEQAAFIGGIHDNMHSKSKEAQALLGVWNMCHAILDEAGKNN